MKTAYYKIINIYQYFLSSALVVLFGRGCRYVPTCSDYAREAVQKHGIAKGTKMTLARLSRCHPWGSTGFDPVE